MKLNDFKLSFQLFSSVCRLPIVSIKLNYPCFFSDFSTCFVSLFLYIVFVSLCFRKGKLWGNVVFTATAINMCICFTYTYRQIIFTLHSGDFAPWRQKHHLWFLKCLPLWVPYLLWLIIRIFLALLQTNYSKVLMQWNYDKYCNWIKSCNTLFLPKSR